jgi:hypothetical protein
MWQSAGFLLLILLVWTNEIFDFAALWFRLQPSSPDITRGCLASAGVLFGMIITVGNTYLQQRRIVSGFLTICSYCHKIRIDQQMWQRIEEYIGGRSAVIFTHGVCPECFEKVRESLERRSDAPLESGTMQ